MTGQNYRQRKRPATQELHRTAPHFGRTLSIDRPLLEGPDDLRRQPQRRRSSKQNNCLRKTIGLKLR